MKLIYSTLLLLISQSLFSQKIQINSNPSGATILFCQKGYFPATTPTKTYIPLESNNDLVVFKDGYYTEIITPVSLGKDVIKSGTTVNLKPYTSKFAGIKTKKIAITKVAFHFDSYQIIGSWGGSNWFYEGHEQTEIENELDKILTEIENGLKDDSLRVSEIRNKDKEEYVDPDYTLEANVSEIWGHAEKGDTYNKINAIYMQVQVKWTLYKASSQKEIGSFISIGAAYKSGDKDYLHKAFYSATRALSLDEAFQKTITIKASANVSATTIDLVKPTTFTTKGDLLKSCIESTVTIKNGKRHGSGFVISKNGEILTSYRTIEEASKIEVIFSNQSKYEAELIKFDEENDVALIKVKPGFEFKPLPINTNAPTIAAEVIGIGTPENISLGQSITTGIISGIRTIEGQNYLQTDAKINAGDSGGPLLNTKGEVIGIIVAKMKGIGTEGIGFAIPMKDVLKTLNIQFTTK